MTDKIKNAFIGTESKLEKFNMIILPTEVIYVMRNAEIIQCAWHITEADTNSPAPSMGKCGLCRYHIHVWSIYLG